MSLLGHHRDMIPLDDQPDPVEAALRDQIGRLHAEKRDLLGLIERQRVEGARKDAEIHRLRRQLAHIERASRRRWWPL